MRTLEQAPPTSAPRQPAARHRASLPEKRPRISSLASRRAQALLRVGAAGDHHEREADRIATTLVDGPSPDAPRGRPATGPRVGPAGGDLAVPAVERASGGRPLPPRTRAHFESRLHRDLGRVRLHDGPAAAAATDDVGAVAMTFGEHVWLGSGVGDDPNHVLAHELVHVVQQSGPPVLRRFLPYWAAQGGTTTHSEVLADVSRHASVFVEAPIPNANRNGDGFDLRGEADIYAASTTIGLYFSGHQVPVPLEAPTKLRKNGGRYAHGRLSAPQTDELQSINRLGQAPPTIALCDLKPPPGTLEALGGVGQLQAYRRGILLAADQVNDMVGAGSWTPDVSIMSKQEIDALVPPSYDPAGLHSSAQPERQLTLMAATGRRRPVRPLTQARGRLAMAADPDNTGVLNYIWVPSASSLPGIRAAPAIIRLDEQVRERLLDPLRAPPVTDDRSRRGRRMLAERHGTTPRDVPRIAPTRRRLQRRARDPFDLASWRRAHRELDQRRDQHADLLADAGRAAAVRDANVGIERAGVRLPALPTTLRQAGDVADRITFWTGSGALVLARFRDVFGGVFVRVADAYERMRERLRRRLRDQNGPGGGGLPGAAIRVMFTLIKSAARVVVERTVDVLKQSLAAGIGRKLTELVGGDRIAELEERVAQVQAMREEMEQQATDTVDQLVERVIGPYDELLAGFQQISDLIQQVNRVATIVRWGARAIACVSPPAIGCLWALAQGVIEELAAVVVGTCWFQEKVKPLVLELDVVRQLPTRLARLILDAMREVVPAGLRDVFGEVDVPTLDPDEVECDPSGSGHGLSESQRALLELQEELGEERFRAWLELEHAAGVPGSRPFTVASARALADVIRDSGASASDLRRWARAAEGQLVTIPMPVGEFLAEMGGRDLAEEAVVGDPGPVPGQGSGSGSAEGGGGRVATARGEPTDRDIGEDAVGITWHPRVISGVTPAHTKHARVELHAWLWGEVGGREIGVLVDPVHARVTRRFHRRREGHRVRTIELTVPRQTFELEHELYGIERVYVGPGSFLHEFRPDTPTTSGRQP